MTEPTRREVLAHATVAIAAVALVPLAARPVNATATEHQVEILKFKFSPDNLQVKPGDKIIWTNHDIVPHTATANDKSWDTGLIAKGKSKSITVTRDMPTDYFCRYHQSMKAKLEVST